MSACTLDQRVAEERDHAAWSSGILDLARCSRLEILITLYENETAGIRPEKWPQAVQLLIEKHIAAWAEKNAAQAIRAVTFAAPKYQGQQSCVVILHHSAKKD